jgi:hypothetical protein
MVAAYVPNDSTLNTKMKAPANSDRIDRILALTVIALNTLPSRLICRKISKIWMVKYCMPMKLPANDTATNSRIGPNSDSCFQKHLSRYPTSPSFELLNHVNALPATSLTVVNLEGPAYSDSGSSGGFYLFLLYNASASRFYFSSLARASGYLSIIHTPRKLNDKPSCNKLKNLRIQFIGYLP